MATKLHTEPRRHYSWWWDSHISPKNSKWLQENLADADMKINTIIKLLEEDADSFARKAEMYYKKRPELMKLVEELYRAYRALAERYDHATGALRQAQRTMAEAFPNQISLLVSDELSYGSVGNDAEPHTPEAPPPLRALFDPDDLQKDALSLSSDLHVIKRNGAYFESNDSLSSKKGLKQLNEMFAFRDGSACTSEGRVRKGLNFQEEEGESSEVRTLMWSRETIQDQEKPDANYVVKGLQQDIAQLSAENENMKNQIMEETDRATRAENELQKLKDTISKLTLEKDAYVTQCQASLQKIAALESHLSATQNELKKVNDEMLTKVNRLQSVEETNQFLMSDLEMPRKKENMLDHELTRKQDELEKLHDSIDEKYQKFMQAEIARYLFEKLHTHSMEEITHLSREIEKEIKKSSEMEQCNMDLHREICKLKEETSRLHEQNIHSSLTIEELKDKIILLEEKNRTFENEVRLCLSDKDTLNQELSRVKDDKILLEENYQDLIKQKELVSIHLDSLEEAVKLLQNENFELKVVTKKQEADKDLLVNKLKDMDIVLGKNVVLEKLLSDAKIELQVLRGNISALEKLHDSLNGEVSTHITEKKELISHAEILNQEVKNLSEKNRFLEKSLCDASSEIGSLRSKLKGFEELFQLFNEQRSDLLAEKNSLLAQIQILTQNVEAHSVENSSLERLLSDITSEVQCLKSKLKVFEESCQSLSDENSELLAERKNFVSQVEILTQDVEKHMDKNSFLENSLSDMGSEVEALKEKLKELEESCQCLGRQNTSLLAERNALVSQVEVFTLNVEKLSDKNTTLEYSLSDANSEVGHLRSKLRDYEESMRSLNDQNSGLLAERNFLLSQVENLSQNVEKLSEKNSFMENSLSDVNSEVWCVRSKLKESEEFCRLLSNKNSSLIAERNTILNQVETLTQNVQKLSERNSFLENCLSDIRNEAECLRLKLKEFEKSCQSLSNQNSNLIGERSTVLAQVEILSQNAVKLSEQNLLLEDSLLDIKNEAGCLRSRLTEYEKSCQALSDQNSDLLAERSDLVSQTVALTQNTERLSEKNSLLESSLVAVCNEVGYLKSKLKDSEESCQLLSNENSNFVSERNSLLIQIETLTQNVEKHAERNSILEISLSDVGNELGCLKSKLKDFEKSCQSLSDQNSELLAERRDFITQAEVNTQNVVKFSEKNSLLENLLSAISNEVGCLNSKLKDCGESCQILGDGNSSIVAERNILLIQVKTLALNVEKLSERNSILETSLSDVSNEVGCLRSKLKDYEKFCQSLTDQKSEFLAERNDLIARADVLTQNLEKFSVKNSSLENSLSAVSTEVECLKSKLKDSEESWKSLNDQNSSLLAERSTLSAQVEFLTGNTEKLSEKSSLLESSLSDVSTEVECLRSKLKCSEESNKSVNDQNSCLLAERNDLLSQREVLAKEVEKLSERNSFLEHSVSEVSSEVGPLRSKLKDLENSCLFLNDQNSGLLSERKTILSQLEILTQNGEKLSEQNLYLENTLSDFSAEVVCLKSKLKDFEEKCRSICDQKSSLLIERNTLASQVETITLNLKNLENSFVELKHKYGKLSEERDLLSNQTRDMKNLLKLEKEENETLLQACKSQLVVLENQNFLMRQENILKEEELEEEQSNIIGALIENFVLERSLCNVNDKNFALSIECQKNLQACRSAELLVSQLEQEKLMHIKTIMSLSEQNEKLIKGICFLQNTLIVEKNFGFLNEDQDKDPLDFIFEQILCSVSKAEYDNQLMHLEISVLVTLLKHAKLELVSFRLEKCSLERELGIKSQEILSLRKEQSELLGLNENLMKEIEISNQREKDLRTEANVLCDQLNDLQESLRTCKCELLNLIEEKKIMKEQFYELRQIHNLLEEENLEVLAEAMKLDHLCLLFRSLSIEQLMELKSLIYDLNSLYSAKNSLISEVNKQKTVIKMLKADNLLLVESLACVEEEFKNNLLLSEFDLFTATFVCEELNLERESIENQLEHTQSHLSEINQKVQSTQLENLNLFKILQGLQLENEATKLVKENLEQKISYLSEVVSHKTEDIRCLGEAKEHLQEEIYQKQGEIEVLMRREEGLLSKLQKEMYENEPCEAEIESLLSEIHLSTFSAALYEDRVIELMIEEEVSSVMRKEMLIAEVALVKEYVDSLNRKLDFGEVESQGLKSRLDIHSSLVTSLWNEIAFLEKQIVGAAKLKLAIHHKKEHNDSQPSECHEAINDECVSMLEKLISKVKALEEVFMHTLNDREQEKPVASTNLASTETEVLRRKELGLQQEVQLSKNLNRKFDVGLNDVEISKGKNGLIIKDIELDQDSSSLPRRTIGSYGLGRINIDEIDDQLWEAAEKNYSNRIPKASTVSVEHDIEPVEEEKSEYPSSELMFEESSIDKYQIPKSAFASRQEWNKRLLRRLTTDSQRLSDLRTTATELKRRMDASQMGKLPSSLGYDKVQTQLKDAQGSVEGLIDMNRKLTNKVEEYSPVGIGSESEDSSSTGRKQISEQARKESEKIGRLELELHKIQYVMLKLEEEHASRQIKASDRRASTLLRDYIYGRRRDGRGKTKNSPFCGCIRPRTKG